MSTVPCFYLDQDAAWEQPCAILERTVLRDRRDRGEGRFINNGRAFRLFKRSPGYVNPRQPQPNAKDTGRDGHGRESCNITEPTDETIGIMSRFVMGERLAKAIVESWRPNFRAVSA